jgi:hypothetical protein
MVTTAGNRYEQALATLFARSNWTLEELAAAEGKKKTWAEQVLRFGKFLNFSATAEIPESMLVGLSERGFRAYWKAADTFGGNERMRFAAVQKAMRETPKETPTVGIKTRPRPHVGEAVVAEYADGKWHTPETITNDIPDATLDEVTRVLESIIKNENHNCRAEKRKYGKGHQYRIFKQDKLVATSELRTKLQPLITELKTEGRKNMTTMDPSEVARLAALLQRLLDEWEQ